MHVRSFARPAGALVCLIVMAACGNREATEPNNSALAVVVVTPNSRAGWVAVQGPSASQSYVPRTDTLRALAPGRYGALAEDVASPDSLVSPVLVGTMSDSAVMIEAGEMKTVTATYTIRGGSGALWVGMWGSRNLAEGYTSPQLALAGTATATDTIGAAGDSITVAGAAFDSAGNLWATDYINQQILKFTPAQLASGSNTPVVRISLAKEPWGIAFDSHGNLWVGSYNGNYVYEYALSDVSAWSGSLTDPLPARSVATPNGPLSIAFDGEGSLWVAGFDVPLTYKISAASIAAGGALAPTDSLVSSYLDRGSGLAFDRAGNLWEGTELGYIVSYTPAQLTSATHGEPSFAQLGAAFSYDALAFDNSGNLWAATESADVELYAPAQLASGNLSAPARALSASTGESSFALALDSQSGGLPIARTISSSRRSSGSRGPLASIVGAPRALPPTIHPNDGSKPGSVRRW